MFEADEGVHRGCGWAQLGVIKLVIETKSAGYDLSGPKVTVGSTTWWQRLSQQETAQETWQRAQGFDLDSKFPNTIRSSPTHRGSDSQLTRLKGSATNHRTAPRFDRSEPSLVHGGVCRFEYEVVTESHNDETDVSDASNLSKQNQRLWSKKKESAQLTVTSIKTE